MVSLAYNPWEGMPERSNMLRIHDFGLRVVGKDVFIVLLLIFGLTV